MEDKLEGVPEGEVVAVAGGARVQKLWFVVKSMNLEPETGAQVQTLSQMTRSPISLVERLMVSITARRPDIRGIAAGMFPWQKRWVSVRQGQEMDQKREAEAPPGGLKGQAKRFGCYSEAAGSRRQGSLLSREQIFKAGSRPHSSHAQSPRHS